MARPIAPPTSRSRSVPEDVPLDLNPFEERILVVEDDVMLARTTARVLEGDIRKFTLCHDVASGIRALDAQKFDVVLSDFDLPDGKGIEVLSHARNVHPETPRILITSHVEWSTAAVSVNEGEVFRVIAKPWTEERLARTVDEALALKRMRDEHRELKLLSERQQRELASATANLVTERLQYERVRQEQSELVLKAVQEAVTEQASRGAFDRVGFEAILLSAVERVSGRVVSPGSSLRMRLLGLVDALSTFSRMPLP